MYDLTTWRHKDGTIREDHMDTREGDYYGTFAQSTDNVERLASLIGQHDPTGADHMEDAARLAVENDQLRDFVRKVAKVGCNDYGDCRFRSVGNRCVACQALWLLEELDAN